MSSAAIAPEEFNPIHPGWYARYGYPHDFWTRLRAEDPVHWWDKTEGIPFWAITKHADIVDIGKRPDRWVSGPRLTISHLPEQPMTEFPPTLIQLDPPKHGQYRQLVSKRFTPRFFSRMHGDIEQIGKEIVDTLIQDREGGECDFVQEISAPLPIAVIAWMLGVPKSDWKLLFDWTNSIIGAQDPEYQAEGMDSRETAQASMRELFLYFSKLVEEKQKNPADDLVTLFANAEIDGEKLPPMDVLAWCLIIVVAGNETTRNGTTGGMLAFIEHQDQLRRLQADMSLLDSAVEEVVRWTTPIIHFGRTATEDVQIRDKLVKEGESVALFYPSANRDEEVFEDPFVFRIDRNPNRHLGFGVGEHFCLGAHVARFELKIAYKYLLPRLEEIELAGEPERLYSSLVGGIKHLPIRYRLKPA
ncbi:MAG: cytochrome P450 [Myxococcota bacterium]